MLQKINKYFVFLLALKYFKKTKQIEIFHLKYFTLTTLHRNTGKQSGESVESVLS